MLIRQYQLITILNLKDLYILYNRFETIWHGMSTFLCLFFYITHNNTTNNTHNIQQQLTHSSTRTTARTITWTSLRISMNAHDYILYNCATISKLNTRTYCFSEVILFCFKIEWTEDHLGILSVVLMSRISINAKVALPKRSVFSLQRNNVSQISIFLKKY